MRIWHYVRFALVGASFLQGALSAEIVAPPEGVSVLELIAVFFFGILAMVFLIGIQRINPRSAPVWRYPGWSINPFLMGEPLQFFHLIGFSFVAVGVGSALRLLLLGRSIPLTVLFAPATGAGVVAGVYTCTAIYRAKMALPNKSLKNDAPSRSVF